MTALVLSQDILPVTLTTQTRVLAAVVALLFLLFVFEAVRRNRLQERYAVLWVVAGLTLLTGVIFPNLLTLISELLGVRDTTIAFFLLLVTLLFSLAVHFTLTISRQSEQITRLSQEHAMAEADRQRHGEDAVNPVGAPPRS